MATSSPGLRYANAMTPKQYALLSILVLYTSGLSFLMHRSRQAAPGSGLYSIPASIFLAELLKLVVSAGMAYRSLHQDISRHKDRYEQLEQGDLDDEEGQVVRLEKGSGDRHLRRISSDLTLDRMTAMANNLLLVFQSLIDDVLSPDCWKLGVPAALYVAQNLLQMASITVVSPVTYQAVMQLKLLATSGLSTILLHRRYSRQQWLSILVLLVGVIMVSSSKIKAKERMGQGAEEHAIMLAKLLGVMGVLAACTLGSGAAVYMEKVLKSDKKTSLWTRNAQLSLFSLIPATLALLYDQRALGRWYPLQYFDAWAWLTVLARSVAGFLIALILQQTDSILKGIATSVAMVLSILIESLLLSVPINTSFALGATLVVLSSASYIRFGLSN